MDYASYGALAFLSGVVSAKWAMELGYSQLRQAIWGIGGLLFGPLCPLLLYIFLLQKSKIGWVKDTPKNSA